jgi:hypothetical protein
VKVCLLVHSHDGKYSETLEVEVNTIQTADYDLLLVRGSSHRQDSVRHFYCNGETSADPNTICMRPCPCVHHHSSVGGNYIYSATSYGYCDWVGLLLHR